MTRRRTRGLRATVTFAFAFGGLAISTGLALGTYSSARHFLVEQRERTAMRQAFTDAALVRDQLQTSGAQVNEVLGAISLPVGASVYVRRGGEWYSSSLDSAGPGLTSALQPVVAGGDVAVGWTDATEPHAVMVGIPLPAADAEYYEVSVADELDSTLLTLALALFACAALTTVASAVLGRAASRRVLAPLGDVTSAAVRVSAGDLSTRLSNTDDPDLAALVGAFNSMVDALHERIEQDARFAADVSHELRTPVTTLTTSVSLLRQKSELSPQATRAVELMADEIERLHRALEDLLELGRLDTDPSTPELTLVPADELVRQALRSGPWPNDVLAPLPDPAHRPLVEVDRRQVLRALTNLFRNADLHGGGLTGVRIESGGGHVDIHVEDHGPGVATEDRSRVFERFARAGARKSGTGSGLGLSIVQQTVRANDGDVWCADRPGGGADFVLRLPHAQDDAS
jgi:signal transduction histidine kinase